MTEEVEERPKKKKVNGATYTGKGAYIHGVPARDMTAEEWQSFSQAEREHFVNLGLFEVTYD